ncbi:hypothetical protein [Oleiagrimonas soli]|uniref:Uncharacterized protein n=1 Tax=Oleiagrimonas soli TaxID=1543381 RepID=A0A841KLE4_9GAMM|nr:hypothetical protein [Oleiagrimonas soli]MBB6183481.1 hypothetical protein [Oleiagrimonas soli]
MVALHAHADAPEGRRDAQALRRAELDITIDHRLGVHFPAERREALWRIQQTWTSHPLRSLLASFGRDLLHGRLSGASTIQARMLVQRYADVLNQEELCAYFDLDADEVRSLLDV